MNRYSVLLPLLSLVVLCFCGSPVIASTLNVWLDADQVTSGDYAVRVYASITDPADANSGLCDMAITITTPGTYNVTVPGTSMFGKIPTVFNADNDWNFIPPARVDYDHDGDNDALQLVAGTGTSYYTGGLLSGPRLIATETWTMNSYQAADLSVYVDPGSRRWDLGNLSQSYSKSFFDCIQITGIHVGPPSSGTITRAPVINVGTSTKGKVDTARYQDSNVLVGIDTAWFNGDAASGGTVDFGDGTSSPLTTPLASYISHTYTLPTGVNIRDYTVSVTADNTAGSGSSTTAVSVMRHPVLVARINGQIVSDGQTLAIPSGTIVTVSLADSQGYISSYTMANDDTKWNWGTSTWTGKVDTLYGDLGLSVDNGGLNGSDSGEVGISDTSMNVTIVPEPASCVLLILGGLTALSRRRKR